MTIDLQSRYKSIISKNYFFVPFAVETLGPMCEDAKSFIDSFGLLITSITGEPKTNILNFASNE